MLDSALLIKLEMDPEFSHGSNLPQMAGKVDESVLWRRYQAKQNDFGPYSTSKLKIRESVFSVFFGFLDLRSPILTALQTSTQNLEF